jgi:signal transduction histidine kinase
MADATVMVAGEPVTEEDEIWEAASAELTPDKSLARVEEKAKYVVTNVGLIGTLLTGLGVLAATQLPPESPAYPFAVAAAVLAAAGVILAFFSLLLRITPAVAPGNLTQVEAWYTDQLRRAGIVRIAGALLLLGIVLAAVAGILAVVNRDPARPVLLLQVSGEGQKVKLLSTATFTGLAAGDTLRTQTVGVDTKGRRILLAQAITGADRDGKASTSVEIEVKKLSNYQSVESSTEASGITCMTTMATRLRSSSGSAGSTTVCSSS